MAKIVKEVEVTRLIVETDEGYLETAIEAEGVEEFIASHEWRMSDVRLKPGRMPRQYHGS